VTHVHWRWAHNLLTHIGTFPNDAVLHLRHDMRHQQPLAGSNVAIHNNSVTSARNRLHQRIEHRRASIRDRLAVEQVRDKAKLVDDDARKRHRGERGDSRQTFQRADNH
jgi:hypothetical protein